MPRRLHETSLFVKFYSDRRQSFRQQYLLKLKDSERSGNWQTYFSGKFLGNFHLTLRSTEQY